MRRWAGPKPERRMAIGSQWALLFHDPIRAERCCRGRSLETRAVNFSLCWLDREDDEEEEEGDEEGEEDKGEATAIFFSSFLFFPFVPTGTTGSGVFESN
ncbi:hypothetical protein GOODEAATRI_022927 [Goodea atripinnis]|uniref:Uncharacterized protein n=1 Tax=Goodea atripinnis TaxID=208336 RepID=A0ABV0NCT8_9TELE